MKKKLLLILLASMMFVCIIALVSCEGIIIPGVTDNPGTNNENPSDNENSTYLVKYYYDNDVIHQQSVKSGKTLTSFQLKEKDELASNGIRFTGFFADSAMTKEFDFDAEITKNVNVYCQLLHTVTYYYANNIIKEHKVDALSGYLTQAQADELTEMRKSFDAFYVNKDKTVEFDPSNRIVGSIKVYCQTLSVVKFYYMETDKEIDGLRQRVDTIDGFTDEQIATIYDYKYNGFCLDYFYSDNKTCSKFDFDVAPKRDIVIYCERDENKAGKNVKWEFDSKSKTITFSGNGDMYDYLYKSDVPWSHCGALIENVVIEKGITSVAGWAFSEFNRITKVKLPDTVKRINKNAFYKSSIVEINFPDALESIGTSAFSNCDGLVHLDFNQGLTTIESNAFSECESLTTVVLTPTIIGVGTSAFKNCTNIETAYYIGNEEQFNIDISISNFWIDQLAHKYFLSQERPEEPGPFWYYDDEGNIAQWYYTIWYYASKFDKLPFDADYIDVENGISQANIDFMNDGSEETGTGYHGYKFIGWHLKDSDYNDHYTLTLGDKYDENIRLVGDRGYDCGDNVEWIFEPNTNTLTISKKDASVADAKMWDFTYYDDAPWYMYRNRIKNVIISDDITHIGSYAFSAIYDDTVTTYEQFSYIVIPKSVTSVHVDAFYRCNRLLYIYYEGTNADVYGTETEAPTVTGLNSLSWFDNSANVAKLYTKAEEADFATLGAGSYWTVLNTGADENNNLRVAWSYDDATGTLLVGGGDDTHIMVNYTNHNQTPWYSYRNDVKKVVINSNIKTIGDCSFENMKTVTEIVVKSKVLAKISGTAFVGTGYYNTEYANKGAVYIYTDGTLELRYAHLIKVDPAKAGYIYIIPARTASISEQAFEGCVNIKKLVFSKDIGVNSVCSTAMVGLTELEEIYFNGAVTTWSKYANIPTHNGNGAEIKVLHYFTVKPTEAALEEYGFTLAECWHWLGNKENTELIIWADEEA